MTRKHAKPKNPVKAEPVMLASAAGVVITIAAFLGLDLDRETATGLVSLAILVVGAWARSRVTPVADDDPAARVRARNEAAGR